MSLLSSIVIIRHRHIMQHCQWTLLLATWLITNFMSSTQWHICTYALSIYAHETLGQCDLYFLKWQPFSFFLYLPLLRVCLITEPLNLIQMYIHTSPKNTKETDHYDLYSPNSGQFSIGHIEDFLIHTNLNFSWT